MKNAGGENRVGVAFADAIGQMLEIADPATGDDRYLDRIGDSAIRLNMNINYYFCIESIFNYLFSFLLAAITGCIIGFS